MDRKDILEVVNRSLEITANLHIQDRVNNSKKHPTVKEVMTIADSYRIVKEYVKENLK